MTLNKSVKVFQRVFEHSLQIENAGFLLMSGEEVHASNPQTMYQDLVKIPVVQFTLNNEEYFLREEDYRKAIQVESLVM